MRIVILGIGASGIIAQFVLVRELLVNFNGNEFSLGFILGSWLLAEALGAYSARHIRFSITNYRFLIFLFGIIFPVTVGIVKIIRPITSTLPGEIFTLTKMLLVSFAMISPVSFIHGMLFTGSSEILVRELKDKHKVSGYVYSLENLGTIIGGVIFSLFLLPRLSATLIALSVSFMNTLLGVFISKENNKSKYWWTFIGCVLLGLAIGYTPKFEKWALTKNFPYYNVLGSLNTHYSNVTIVMREDQQTFYIDGMPTINIPNYDRVFIEEFVNFPLLTHNNPEKILIIGGGIGGVIKQLITCNIKEIIYVESDPDLISIIKSFSTHEISEELNSPKVKIIHNDPRLFIATDTNKYDLIFINLIPLTIQINRCLTKEFFILCRKRLNNGGILVTTTPGSTTYLSSILRKLIFSHINTLKKVFPHVNVIFGDFTLYLSHCDANQKVLNAESLYFRLVKRNFPSQIFNKNYIDQRSRYFYFDVKEESLKSDVSQRIKVNSDLVPWGLFYNLNYYNLIFNPKLQRVFENVENLNFLKVFWGIILLFAIITKFFRYYKIDLTMGFAIFTTGFGAMLATLIVSFVFQLHHGYLYYQVSILLTTFIIGSAIGAYISNFIQSTKIRNVLLNETIIITFFCFVLVTLLFFSNSKIFNNLLVFYIILLVGGFLMGAEFPLANKLDMRESSESNERVRKILGKLYAFDLLGGFLGALLGATALLPTIGVINTIIVVILLKVVSIFLILTKK